MEATKQVRAAAADKEALIRSVAGAEVVTLLMSLVQLTGDTGYLDEARPYIAGAWNFQHSIPQALQEKIRTDLIAVIERAAAENWQLPEAPTEALTSRMMSTAVGAEVPDLYMPLFREEMNFGGSDARAVTWRTDLDTHDVGGFKAVIIGAGFSGIAMAIRLQQAGIPYVLIEKNPDVGGTWLENVYPGCSVDTPCHFYSYAFETNSEWTSYFAKRDEIQQYILDCVQKYGIREKIRFGEEVTSAHYDAKRGVWQIQTVGSDGTEASFDCNALISAVGALNRPSIPRIPGLENFKGSWFHTARWDRTVDLTGKRVVMIGTGASGVQVGPAIAPSVDKLTIVQRSPHWMVNHPLYHAPVTPEIRWAMRHIPFYASWFRFQLFWGASESFHSTLKIDPDWHDPKHSINKANSQLREQLVSYIKSELEGREDLLPKVIPEYPPFGKRMLRDTHWYKMLRRPNVELVTEGVERIEADAVVVDGIRHPADIIVFATGFDAAKMLWPMDIVGKDGASIRDVWGDENPRAHLGITLPRFPNFFMMYGPNTNLAHGGSAIFHSECQARYIMLALRELIEGEHRAMEVKNDCFEGYNKRVDSALRQMVWSHPGVKSWYKNKSGRIVMNSPWRLVDYRNMTADLNLDDYTWEPHVDSPGEACDAEAEQQP